MSTTYYSEERSLLDAKYQEERYTLDIKQYIEVYESERNNESVMFKAEMLLRHASEILDLSQLYLNKWTNIAIKQRLDNALPPFEGKVPEAIFKT